MSDETMLRPADVARELGVSTATLRRWSRRFHSYLALTGEDADGRSHRRYVQQDVDTLREVKTLLDQGWTYEQVAQRLRSDDDAEVTEPLTDEPSEDQAEADASGEQDLFQDLGSLERPEAGSNANLPAESLPPAVQFVRDTVKSITDNQQIILNAQQAARDMMGVMIQDNLNLKSENTSLRERMLDLERELAELRRRHADYRENMETRVNILEDAVANLMAWRQRRTPATPPPSEPQAPIPSQAPRRSFWSRLIGG